MIKPENSNPVPRNKNKHKHLYILLLATIRLYFKHNELYIYSTLIFRKTYKQLINKNLSLLYTFHALDEYLNTLSNKSPILAGYFAETSKNISKKEKKSLKSSFLTPC